MVAHKQSFLAQSARVIVFKHYEDPKTSLNSLPEWFFPKMWCTSPYILSRLLHHTAAALLERRKRHRCLPNSDSGLKLLEMQYTLWIELLFLPTQFLRMKLSLAFQQLLSSTPLLQTQRKSWDDGAVQHLHLPSSQQQQQQQQRRHFLLVDHSFVWYDTFNFQRRSHWWSTGDV